MTFQLKDKFFHLQTENCSYIIGVNEKGHLIHLHYGEKLPETVATENLFPEMGMAYGTLTSYDEERASYSLETETLEFPGNGKGDYRSPAYELIDQSGCSVFDFVYQKHQHIQEIVSPEGLPDCHNNHHAGSQTKGETLIITLKDTVKDVFLHLHYTLLEGLDVILRYSQLENKTSQDLKIDRLLSSSIDFETGEYEAITLDGSWIKERSIHRRKIDEGEFSISSRRGISSAQHSPFMALATPDSDENHGNVWASLLIYSGNHKTIAERNFLGITRFQQGLNPESFNWLLKTGESFSTPRSVLAFSNSGISQLSSIYHEFIKHNLVRGEWQYKERPVVINNWEATYFKFNEKKLLKIASEASSVGVELFVLDDGWFGKRDDDTTSLGDWFVNKKKLPSGIDGLAQKLKKKNMKFGLWVEPEMISKDSDLYRAHPDWLMCTPGREPSPGRNQYVLDLCNSDVCDYLISTLSTLFSSAEISYIKWDMNRSFSDQYSPVLPPERQQEMCHRYVLGLYVVLKTLTEKFPQILFESCASGGARFDAGMMAFMPQVWTSDNTDAGERVSIQNGSSIWAPQSVMAAHVSGTPNHQILRSTSLESRFNTAAFGLLGYEQDLDELTPEEKRTVKKQILFYKEYRSLLQFGKFIRLPYDSSGNKTCWIIVSDDQKTAILGYFQKNSTANPGSERIILQGLDREKTYQIQNRTQYHDLKAFGSLINDQLPVSLAPNSFLHKAITSNFSLEVEKTDYKVSGQLLMTRGFRPHRQFNGTGVDDNTAIIRDFDSRIYIIKAI